jgi:hypothetical protein
VALVPIAALAVLGVALFGPDLSITRSAPETRSPTLGAPSNAVVRSRAALLYREPDRMSAVVGTLAAGSPLVVHKLVWNMMSQWAEVETGSGSGYVAVTDVDLR